MFGSKSRSGETVPKERAWALEGNAALPHRHGEQLEAIVALDLVAAFLLEQDDLNRGKTPNQF